MVGFLCSWQVSTLERLRRRRDRRLCHRRNDLGVLQFSHSWRPDLLCSTVLWSTRTSQLCSPLSSSSAAVWYGRNALRWPARGHHALECFPLCGPRVMVTFHLFCRVWWRSGFYGVRLLQGFLCRRRVWYTLRLRRFFFRRQLLVLGVFPVLDFRLYLAFALCLI
jgi:hypothetical protein